MYRQKYIKTSEFRLNPLTGSMIGGALGAGKGALEQDPYEEVSPGDRALRVLGNAAIGAGIGGSVGLAPRLLAENPTANKVSNIVKADTGVDILPQPQAVRKINNRSVNAEAQLNDLLDQQQALEKRAKLRQLERELARQKRTQTWQGVVEGVGDIINPALIAADSIGEKIGTATTVAGTLGRTVVDAGRNTYQAGRNARQLFYTGKYIKTSNFSYDPLPISRDTLAKSLAIGAGVGTLGGGLYGATSSMLENQSSNNRRLQNLQNIQDPYLRIRQQEIYDSTPAQIGRSLGDSVHGVGSTALGMGVGAGIGATALTGGLLAYKGMQKPTIAPTVNKGNRFLRAAKTLVTG